MLISVGVCRVKLFFAFAILNQKYIYSACTVLQALFELLVVSHTSKLFHLYHITRLRPQIYEYMLFTYSFNDSFFTFLNRLLLKILACLTYMAYLY
jgi:hypothetical protein